MNTNILIFTKDPVLRQATVEALREGGFNVTVAHDSYETVDKPDLAAVELVVLDLDCEGKAAWSLVERLLEKETMTPIVCLTSTPGGASWAWTSLADVTLEKPVPPARLVAAACRLIAEPSANHLQRNSRQRMVVRYARPYVWADPVPAAYRGWGIND